MRKHFAAIVSLSILVGRAAAWGPLGHEAIGMVAQEFLAPNAKAFVQSTLGSPLASSANWADDVASQPGFTWSKNLHFMSGQVSSDACATSELSDCTGQDCIVTAIANFTSRMVDPNVSAEQKSEALKFIDHLVGDIGQPLHVEGVSAGDGVQVTCSGVKTNLFAAWDSAILATNVNATHSASLSVYAVDLIAKIKTGSFKALTREKPGTETTTMEATATATEDADSANARQFAVRAHHQYPVQDDQEYVLVGFKHPGSQQGLKTDLTYWMVGTYTRAGTIRKVTVLEMEDENDRKTLRELKLASVQDSVSLI
ncbi:hypothetical protein NM688_g5482 [Phlebia brevispora]|uniref:Uncharacterized protein n=1 Tax=Phlebia brevispora TaxID=194682 RepID=A0ACC1SUR2_9APHY|nr:hypothetical protein NM688_g5482 [Phlebia brevispora]